MLTAITENVEKTLSLQDRIDKFESSLCVYVDYFFIVIDWKYSL